MFSIGVFDRVKKVVKEIDRLGYLSAVLENFSIENDEEELLCSELEQLLNDIKDNALYKTDSEEEDAIPYIKIQGHLIPLSSITLAISEDYYDYNTSRQEFRLIINPVEVKFKPTENIIIKYLSQKKRDKDFESLCRELDLRKNVKIKSI